KLLEASIEQGADRKTLEALRDRLLGTGGKKKYSNRAQKWLPPALPPDQAGSPTRWIICSATLPVHSARWSKRASKVAMPWVLDLRSFARLRSSASGTIASTVSHPDPPS